jgi:DnaJ like chaperone protein
MSWYGRIIGGSIGAIFGPGGAVAGASFGHYYDSRNSGNGQPGGIKPVPMSKEKRRYILFHHTFAMFAKMAKADDYVIQEEVDTIKKFMAEPLHLSAETKRQATAIFNKSKKDNEPYSKYSEEYALAYKHDPQTKAAMFEMLLAVALADGVLHPKQDVLLVKTLHDFELNCEIYENIRRELLPNMDSLYQTMGCNPESSDKDLKKAFRDASKDYHPDTLSASNVSAKVKELAIDKFKEINSAYKTLCKLRNIK